MAHWQKTLDVSDIWNKARTGEITYEALSKEVATRLKALNFASAELELIIAEFESEDVVDADSFDYVLAMLYNWADQNHRLWIDTIGKVVL